MIEVIPAQSGQALEHLIQLSQEYVDWMIAEIRVHYPDLSLSEFRAEHDYDDVRKKFPGEHVPPHGCLLVALNGSEACGCVALGKLTETIGELRTLYVRPACRGTGVGRKLVEAALKQGRNYGYRVIRLDTLEFMDSAQKLYRSFGFGDIPPYLEMSDSLKRHICFLELKLSN